MGRGNGSLATVIAVVVLTVGGFAMAGLARRKKARLMANDLNTQEAIESAPADLNHGASHVQCPVCQKRLKVPSNVGGKKVKCPGCAAAFVA